MLRISVDIRGVKPIQMALERVRSRAGDLSPVFRQMQQSFYEMEQQQFASRGGQNPWPSLSTKYALWKEKHYPGMPLMELTGDLKQSLIAPGGENIATILPHEARFGTSRTNKKGYPYPMAHQEGRGNNPQRRLIDPTRERMLSWARMVQRYLKGGWGASGSWRSAMVSGGL